jgi:hypothetical protein
VQAGELVVLALLTLWSVTLLAALLLQARARDLVFLGGDSRAPGDQLVYLSWITDGGRHLFGSPRLDDPVLGSYFVHPMWTPGRLLWELGIDPRVVLLSWKPVAVLVLFLGVAAYVRDNLPPDPLARLGALVLALFFYPPAQTAIHAAGAGPGLRRDAGLVAFEISPHVALWGYLPKAVAVGLMPVFLICVDRVVEPARRRAGRGGGWYVAWASAAGLAVGWLHPWQGATLAAIVVGLALWGSMRRRFAALAIPLAATLLPLGYYLLLSRLDPVWAHRAMVGEGEPRLSPLVLAAALAPLAIPALAGLTRPSTSRERILWLWAPAALLVWALSPAVSGHALGGLSIPLAVLAVRGLQRARRLIAGGGEGSRGTVARAVSGGLAALVLVLCTASTLPFASRSLSLVRQGDLDLRFAFMRPDERRAIGYIAAAPGPGGVLTSHVLSASVPGLARRSSWLSRPGWTPDLVGRAFSVELLFGGALPPGRARSLVRGSRARFVLVPCAGGAGRADLAGLLRELGYSPRRFGCAAVYERDVT